MQFLIFLLLVCCPAALVSASTSDCCLDIRTEKCYSVGDDAEILGSDGQSMKCQCQKDGDTYMFANCKTATCRDSQSNEYKKVGEAVIHKVGETTYHCTCGGYEGYKNCRTEEQVLNEGKCKDANGTLVPAGQKVSIMQSSDKLICDCSGTNSYQNCRSTTCPDISGSRKAAGEKVTVAHEGQTLICDCAGVDGYKNCKSKASVDNPDRCKDVNNKYVNKGEKYKVKFHDNLFMCTCDGDKGGKDCTPAA